MYDDRDVNVFDNYLLEVLNQHGIDSMLSIVHDEVERAYSYGFDVGKDDGWIECYEAYEHLIECDDYD